MILPFDSVSPTIKSPSFLAEQSVVIGDVHIGAESSIWFQTVLRGDVNSIRIGSRTNIQDLCMVHVTTKESPHPAITLIGDEVTIGHRVILHGCTVGNRCLVGMGSIVMDGVKVGEESIIGAGSLVTEHTHIPPGHLALGSPAKVVRPLKDEERKFLKISADHYWKLAQQYLKL